MRTDDRWARRKGDPYIDVGAVIGAVLIVAMVTMMLMSLRCAC